MTGNPLVPDDFTFVYDSVLRTMRDSYEEELHLLARLRGDLGRERRALLREAIAAIDAELAGRGEAVAA